MILLPQREQLILFITFVVIFIIFWIDEKRLKDKDHILNKIFYYLPSYNSDQRTGFSLVTVAAVASIFGIYLNMAVCVLIIGLFYIYKGRN